MRRVDEGALETDGRDPSVPCGLLGGSELSMAGRGDSVRFNPAVFVSDGGGGLKWRIGFRMLLKYCSTTPRSNLPGLLAGSSRQTMLQAAKQRCNASGQHGH